MDNKHNSLNLAAKIEAHSFARAKLLENCSLLGTDNVRGQISEHIFAPNEGYCLSMICLHDLLTQFVDHHGWMEHSSRSSDWLETP